jgi:ubiquinone/menaquinone biosynthesis C-methylase UbiE
MLNNKRSLHTRVCPWWLASSLDNPLRRLFQDPDKLLSGLVSEGQAALDIGCGPGYFTIPLARRVGAGGQVIAIDLQREMLEIVRRKAIRAGLLERIAFHNAEPDALGVREHFDFALAFWMLHEVPDQGGLLRQVRHLLKPGAGLLIAEPVLHVTAQAFQKTVETACLAGFAPGREVKVILSRAGLFHASVVTS